MAEQNAGLWAGSIAQATQKDFKDIPLNEDLFNKLTLPACFKQCSRTDIDVVFKNEMECTYKCMITYKDTLRKFQQIDHE